jgi:hypothetical protein
MRSTEEEWFFWSQVLAGGVLLVFLTSGCHGPPVELRLVELRPNAKSDYYDAVVEITGIVTRERRRSSFTVSSLLRTAAPGRIGYRERAVPAEKIVFLDAGQRPDEFEAGDVFVFPLRKPEFDVRLATDRAMVGYLNVWEQIPEEERWDPRHTEAMRLAGNLGVRRDGGVARPVPRDLPAAWACVEDVYGEERQGGMLRFVRKIDGRTTDEVLIHYRVVGEEEEETMRKVGQEEFLLRQAGPMLGKNPAWARRVFRGGTLAGHKALIQGMDRRPSPFFPPIYQDRYLYFDDGLVVQVLLRSAHKEVSCTAGRPEQR